MKAFRKDVFKTIKGSLGRFLAIFLIVGLGSGFYAALRMVCPDMKIAADNYFDSTELMDVRVVSTLGLVEKDLDVIKNLDSVEKAALAYETDVTGTLNGEHVTMRIHSLTNVDSLNTIELKEGRMPEKQGECVISTDCVINTDKNIGDIIEVTDCVSDVASTLSTKKFEIVGKVESPLYVDYASPGNTTLGSGMLDDYAYVTNDSFAESYPYNEIFLTVRGAKDKFFYSSDYEATIQSAIDEIKTIAPEREQARLNELKDGAQAELDKSKSEYAQKEAEAHKEINDAESMLNSSKQLLEDSRIALDKTPVELLSAHEKLSDATSQLEAAKTTLNYLKTQQSAFAMTEQMAKQALDATPKDSSQYESVKNQYDTLVQQKRQLDEGIQQAESSVADGEKQLESAREQYNSAKSQYYSGVDSYYSGLNEYNEGTQTLQTNKQEAETQLAEAKKKLDEAQDQINKLKTPEWLFMDRSKVQGAESFKTDAERVDSIAQLFPLIFFLVAALVALTTMTRMIEEERLNIGTYKALGYSRSKISQKFLVYSLFASATGAIFGIVLLSEVLPAVIMDAYGAMYRMPHDLLSPIDLPIAAISFLAGVGITVAVTLGVAWASLRENPASLMRPKTTKSGSKILFERITFLWNRLSFSGKVTVRNLFRYKKRSAMTIIGIAGCTGLLLTGFGLNDALNDMIDKQYNELVSYNATVSAKTDATESNSETLSKLMNNNTYVESDANVESTLIIATAQGTTKDTNASLIVPKDFSALNNVWKIRDRGSHQELSAPEDGVLITEKLKNMFNLNVGDSITLCQQDDMGNASNKKIKAQVSGVFENYLFNYVICSAETYSELFDGSEPAYTTHFAKLPSNADKAQFTQATEATGAVKSVSYNDETIETYKNSLSAVNMVVIVLVSCAALLAFVVLYNLNNINICERKREIATLQVLGFNRREVEMYIYRETIILTILGCFVGILFGLLLEGFVVSSAEGNMLMFGREIHALSFVISAVITIVFSLFVMFIMRRKFSQVNMVESLKSTE